MTMLRVYFAYGSNMSSPRLIARVGAVEVLGQALLVDHEHRFSKRGHDGTGKGNVEPRDGSTVYGVAYGLTEVQLVHLSGYEGGYRRADLGVQVAGVWRRATTFVARDPGDTPPPSRDYVAHYRRGILEHDLPRTYAEVIFDGLGGWCDTDPMSGGSP